MAARITFIVCFIYAVFGKSVDGQCYQDWEQHEESCYGFGEAEVTWGDAAEMCHATGAKLAEIETAAESDFLKGQAHNKGLEQFWIGGTDVFHEGTWIWISNEQLISFSDWYGNEPNDDKDHEDCVVLNKNYNYQWNDVPCNNEYTFICEMPVKEIVIG